MTLLGNSSFIDSYIDKPFDNPMEMFKRWLEQADKIISEPRGLILSTVDNLGKPSSRVVLLKEIDEKGVIFTSNENSKKIKDLSNNPWAAGNLWWRETIQQINFQGRVKKFTEEKSDEIWYSRTRDAQAVSSISMQSSLLRNKKLLKEKMLVLVNCSEKINRPISWHSYHITIEVIEFWLGSKDRFHKRLQYNLIDNLWIHNYLQP